VRSYNCTNLHVTACGGLFISVTRDGYASSIMAASDEMEYEGMDVTLSAGQDGDYEEKAYDFDQLSTMKANFSKVVRPEFLDTKGTGRPDAVRLGEDELSSTVPISVWEAGQFNLLGQRIERDDSQKVTNNDELIRAFNTHPYEDDFIGRVEGYLLILLSGTTYYWSQRKVVPPGYFGHYMSSHRHKLLRAGVHTLWNAADHWLADVIIDDETNPNRKFGDKVILQVPENHLAGGYRIGQETEGSRDQEFVLFSQGRHVLPESKYYGVNIVKLAGGEANNILKLGPLTIMYVREGWLGGVSHRKTGVYYILYPGPPYLLHEQEYDVDEAELRPRNEDKFTIGPYEFVTVKDGEIAGAYRKSDGKFTILPPGSSYQLHDKEYEAVIKKQRSVEFQLGPYYYLTVQNGFEAGVYRKKDGLFVRLPPGKTYQLNVDDFEKPEHVKRASHITRVGPLTLLTLHDGKLSGAYRHSDGAFVEFTDDSREYVLHEKFYHSLVTVDRNSTVKQDFGPFKVITIREGYAGVFEVEGKIEIKDPGYYKVASNVNISDSIPVKMFQDILPELTFRTKDGVQMGVKVTITWHVTDPMQVARFAGSFNDLARLIKDRAGDAMIRLCKMYNRGDLLPTAQDVEHLRTPEMTDREASAMADEAYRVLQKSLSETCQEELVTISSSSRLGVTVEKVQIERFLLMNETILEELEKITMAQLSAKREKVEGEYQIAKAQAEKLAREKRAEADASVQLKQAEAAAEVRRTEVAMESEARRTSAATDNEIEQAKNDTAVKIAKEKMIQEAEAKAQAIAAITDAEYQRKVKEAEAAARMPPQEFELRKLQMQVEMLKQIGSAAWKYPDVYTGFLEQFGDKLRLGPMSASETLAKMASSQAAEPGAASK